MAVLDLTRDKWKEFKTTNNLSKSSLFSKADVGPHIDDFAKAVAAYRATPASQGLLKVSSKATNLQKAFTTFIGLKEAKAELTAPAKAKIEKWKTQLDDVYVKLSGIAKKFEKELKEGDRQIVEKTLKEICPGF